MSLYYDYGYSDDSYKLFGRSCLNCETRVYEESAIRNYFCGPKPIAFVRQIVWSVILWVCFYKFATNSKIDDFLRSNLHLLIYFIIYYPIGIGLILSPFGFVFHIINELKEYNYLKCLLIERRATLKERQRPKLINPTSS